MNPKVKRLNLFQLKLNASQSIPDADLDLDLLFEICDQDKDGWITAEDLGSKLERVCEEREEQENPIRRLFESVGCRQMSLGQLEEQLEGKCQLEVAQRVFEEIDVMNRGYITYWDIIQVKQMEEIR